MMECVGVMGRGGSAEARELEIREKINHGWPSISIVILIMIEKMGEEMEW